MKNRDVSNYLSGSSRARRRKRFIYWLIFVVLLFYLLLIGFGALVLKTGLFRAKEIKITGNQDVATEDIRLTLESQVFRGSFFNYLLGFNNLLIWPNHIDNPDKFLPQIKSLDIDKSYWAKTITVRVTERSPYGIWCASTGDPACFWFDDSGKIFKKGPLSQGNLIKTVTDSSGRPLGLGNNVLPANYFSNLRSAFEALDASGLGVKSVELKDLALEEITVRVVDGPAIYFSLRFPADWTPAVLNDLMGKSSFWKLNYVDLRIENRAYYK
jgi:hypothetical protein